MARAPSRVTRGSRLAGGLASALLLAFLVAAWSLLARDPGEPPSLAAPSAPAPPSIPDENAADPPAPAGAAGAATAVPAPARAPIQRPILDLDAETHAALEERLAREYAAEQRFEQGLEASQMRARDVDARVRDAFRRVELEPELLEGGRIRGLRIRAVEGGSAFSEAGFRPGDLLTSLDGHPLEDPAELPALLGRLGPQLSVCARRGGSERCRELTLR